MKNSQYIKIIDQTFEGMKRKKETSIIIRLFENITQFIVPSGGVLQTNFAKIILVRVYNQNIINVLYRKNNIYEPLIFMTHEDKQAAVECLRMNKILPSAEEFINARSLLHSLSCTAVEGMIHGDN